MKPTERRLVRHAGAAAELDRAIHDAIDGFGDERLGDRGLLAPAPAGVDHAYRLPDQAARRLDVDHAVGDQILGEAEIVQPLTEQLAFARALERDVEAAARDAQPAHAVREPCGREPDLGVTETEIALAEDRGAFDAAVVEADLAVAADHRVVERLDLTHDLEAGIVAVDEEHRRRMALTGACHHDREGGARGAGDEPLVPVDPPAAVDLGGRRAQRGGIGAGAGGGLGHREAGADLSCRERSQVTGLLLVGRDLRQQVHVALVGRRAVERERAEQAVAGLLEDDALLEQVQREPAVLLRDLRGEKAGVGGLLLQLCAQLRARLAESELSLGGDGDVAHEGSDAIAQVSKLDGQRGVAHGAPPYAVRAAPAPDRPPPSVDSSNAIPTPHQRRDDLADFLVEVLARAAVRGAQLGQRVEDPRRPRLHQVRALAHVDAQRDLLLLESPRRPPPTAARRCARTRRR